ncbi:ABC transporter permease [Pedobacter changchengzhani]|uniref:ABC transporter permease n=1 Tax=Pedobacter changchengzhani TaxID=2529274 RepID=A0A4R5MKF4_9SPHI|nr:FtsX-like permease family protein [Pedobacter changchengzhani]TDG35569.1 ABC transporter permease [Pedobacter changchengzhani]
MNINTDIAKTYIFAGKKQTAVAGMGVLLGMAIYIFMNCLMLALDRSSTSVIFKNNAHIRVYKEDKMSKPLVNDSTAKYLIINPKVLPKSNTIINPNQVTETILKNKNVTVVTPQVNSSVFYNNGKSQISGIAVGVKPAEANAMYNINSTIVSGDFKSLTSNPNGIVIGVGISTKMNLVVGNNLNLTSAKGVNRTFKVVGIFRSNVRTLDDSKSYINLASAQQLQKEGALYITDITVNIKNPDDAKAVGDEISQVTGYKAESWQEANNSMVTGNKMRNIVGSLVSSLILLVAGFGIYNILNMTVSQKINDIAILKAMGFRGKDVVRIFVTQALAVGILGVIGGVLLATVLISVLQHVYVGGDIGYFPIEFDGSRFLRGIFFGLIITFFAGYFPARKAAKVDPVEIFRK